MINEKRPRAYADEIMSMKTREERLLALDKVPDHLRGMVKDHVESAYKINKSKNKRG